MLLDSATAPARDGLADAGESGQTEGGYTDELFRAGQFPRIVFTGENAPITVMRFPRREAVH